jgi:hypothetical protein
VFFLWNLLILYNGFFEFIESDEILEIVKLNSKAFTRKSKMNFTNIIRFMLIRGSDNTTVDIR